MSTHDDSTSTPTTDAPAGATTEDTPEPARPRTWRRALPRGRAALAATAAVVGLAVGGIGFGAGYAVADRSTDRSTTDGGNPTSFPDERFDRPMGGPMGGPGGGPMDGGSGLPGGTGPAEQSPDLDGDGQPDEAPTAPGTDATEDSAQQG